MRTSAAILAAAAILFAGAPAAFAAPATHQFSGQISQINTLGKTLSVKEKGTMHTEMTFALASDAKIMAGPKETSLADLEVGEQVKVSYADIGSKHEAKRIEVMHAKTATAKPYQKHSAN
jgi:hypothetical protein